MNSITRTQFTEAIEAGIAAGGLPEGLQSQLRRHAEDALVTVTGAFRDRGVVCPLSAVGIRNPIPWDYWSFVKGFDDYVYDLKLGSGPFLVVS